MPLSEFPTIRIGQVHPGSFHGANEPLGLNYAQGQHAVALIHEQQSAFASAIRGAIESKKFAGRIKASRARNLKDKFLRKGVIRQAIGAIYDFEEMRLEILDRDVVLRVCVTVCVSPEKWKHTKQTALSKFWIRFLDISQIFRQSPINSSFNDYFLICESLSKEVFSSIRPHYNEIICDVLSRDRIDIQEGKRFICAFTSSTDDSFFDFQNALRFGGSFRDELIRNNAVASSLCALGETLGMCRAPNPDVDQVIAMLKHSKIALETYADIQSYCAAFIYKSTNRADYVAGVSGVSGQAFGDALEARLATQAARNWPSLLSKLPSNKVSAAVIGDYAAHMDGHLIESLQ